MRITKQGYPNTAERAALKRGEKIPLYKGGYVITYDPATGTAVNLGMPIPWGDPRLGAPVGAVQRPLGNGLQEGRVVQGRRQVPPRRVGQLAGGRQRIDQRRHRPQCRARTLLHELHGDERPQKGGLGLERHRNTEPSHHR